MEAQDLSKRTRKQEHYDKRLILKIVKEIEEGLPRKEAKKLYGLGKTTLDPWMSQYGSEHYHSHIKRKSYTQLQKRTVTTAIEQGRLTISEAQRAYGIKAAKTVREWMRAHSAEKGYLYPKISPSVSKQKPVPTSQREAALDKALLEAELKIAALNTLIDVAEQELKIDIRKKSGAKQS